MYISSKEYTGRIPEDTDVPTFLRNKEKQKREKRKVKAEKRSNVFYTSHKELCKKHNLKHII